MIDSLLVVRVDSLGAAVESLRTRPQATWTPDKILTAAIAGLGLGLSLVNSFRAILSDRRAARLDARQREAEERDRRAWLESRIGDALELAGSLSRDYRDALTPLLALPHFVRHSLDDGLYADVQEVVDRITAALDLNSTVISSIVEMDAAAMTTEDVAAFHRMVTVMKGERASIHGLRARSEQLSRRALAEVEADAS